jgi:hypothetical protein
VWVPGLRQQGTSYFLFFVFVLAERKNKKKDKVPLRIMTPVRLRKSCKYAALGEIP